MTALTVTVPGRPVAQGSMRSLGAGRPMVHSNAASLMPWRAAVAAHIRLQMHDAEEWPIEGPVKLGITFHLPRPKSAPRWRLWPDTRPDLDKLCRACCDALTASGVIRDDAQVVILQASKEFGPPGVTLQLRALEQPRRAA